ncbi:DMT family transporter [Mesobacterium sp. TK19101]|uniref:DMT family transporter n=1 Tax=Mesobacterium hydrothermale TaxID=3111907 RepID=A0ABU6HH28_9RHOB|nr:DMT family transporter [Mesobacterium sp. TK19101]MEC3861084.1 DMT family transporter [Mesobacterium sp. TK19101]
MERKSSMDLPGALGMTGFATILAFNQVVVKLVNTGIAPVFGAGLRSALALCVLGIWCLVRGRRISGLRRSFWPGMMLGTFFGVEFLLLFVALDLTTVARSSIVFYSMPVWLAVIAHFLLPGERLTPRRGIGLVLAMAGVALALYQPGGGGIGWGELAALAATLLWAGIALIVRLTAVSTLEAESQLFWQLSVSAVILLVVAPFFGPLLRDPGLWHWAGMGFQAVIVASLGFLFWLSLMRIYPASDIAAFSFLSPVLSVGMGWLILGEKLVPNVLSALVLVAVGVLLITLRRRR